jgi:hypothetical protein
MEYIIRCSPGDRNMTPHQMENWTTTPGSLAAQFNADADGRDPIAFLYPYGLLY